jgi:cytochrome c556
MKIRVLLYAFAVLLVAASAISADEATDEYKKLMTPAATANMTLQKAVQTDLAATAKSAGEMQAAFAKIEDYWAKHNTADAVAAAKSAEAVAKEIQEAAAAGNKDAAVAAAGKVAATCTSCHMAHRTRLPDNTFQLKP